MPVAFVTVKLPDGSLVHLDVDLKTRVEEFRTILAPKSGVKRHKQRLVFSGRLLQDGRSLEAYGVERNSTIHLLHGNSAGGEGPEGVDITTCPSQLGALQRHVLQNPDILQQMLESPAMQSLLNDHDFLRSLLKMDPRLTKLFEGSPQLAGMLHDVNFMRQATEALRNPVHVRDVLRSTDRSMTALEDLTGGSFDVLRSMVQDIKRPMQDENYASAQQKPRLGAKKAAPKGPGSDRGSEDEEARSDAGSQKAGAAGDSAEAVPPPEWLGTFDTNAMAAMMQDQNMQHLLSQLVQTLPGPTAKPHPDDPFLDSGFVGQMFHAQTIHSMALLQEAVGKLSMTADSGGGSAKDPKGKKTMKAPAPGGGTAGSTSGPSIFEDSPAVLSGLNPKSPAADFKTSFQLFLSAEQESPEVRYKGQLQAMGNMGFTDKEACIQALHDHDGNMTKAVEALMGTKK